ncbi:MAG: hypothetical protein M3367_17055 [Acidobacteriota bacterium]|nr:hypothetical protein [Acidobacteriota bacterium]
MKFQLHPFYAKTFESRYNWNMSVRSAENTTENLLKAVVNLQKNEFEMLISNAKKLRRTLPENQANKEIRFIKKVNESVLSDVERIRFNELIEKRRNENISKNEFDELIALTEKGEELNLKQLKYLVEIANIRNKSLHEVMKELEIFPPQTI